MPRRVGQASEELSRAFLEAIRQRATGVVWWWIMPHLSRDEWQRIYHMTPSQAARMLVDIERREAMPATQPLPVLDRADPAIGLTDNPQDGADEPQKAARHRAR